MIKFKTLADAIRLAEAAHYNQTDKAGLPYIEHPRRVMQKVQAQGGLPYVQIAAIFHDITEDTAFTPDMLLALGFSEAAIEIVKLLDRGYSMAKFFDSDDYRALGARVATQEDIDNFYYTEIAKNPGAKMVKLADIEDNLAPWRQSYLPIETQERLATKYAKAHELLGV